MSEIFRPRFSVIDRLILISLLYCAIQIAVLLARVYQLTNIWQPCHAHIWQHHCMVYSCKYNTESFKPHFLTLLIMYVYRRSWQAYRQMLVNNNAYAIKSSCITKTICWSLIILHILPVNNMKTLSRLTVAH